MIGKVISSSTEEVVFRVLDSVDVEDVHVGSLVVIESQLTYLARVTSLELRNLGDVDLADKVAAMSAGADVYDDIQSVLGDQFYYVCRSRVAGIIDGRLRGAKSIPKVLSPVRLADANDLSFLRARGTDTVEIGRVRTLDLPIDLDRKALITHHCGVFGKTGSGKSNTVKVLLSTLLDMHTPALVFDVHGEYCRRDCLGASRDVVVMGMGSGEDMTLSLPLEEIKPRDLKLVSFLNETQSEAVEAIRARKHTRWIRYLRDTDTKTIHQDFDNQLFEPTIDALKRKVRNLLSQPYVGGDFNAPKAIYDTLRKRRTVVIDFGDYEHNDYAIRLITTIVSRYLLDRYKTAHKKGTAVPETLIVLEEAHKLLSTDIARLTIFETIVREGRKFGVGLMVVDQMPRKIHEEVISQLNTVIIMLLTNVKDREHLVASSENDLTAFKDEMARLDVGETIVTGISVPLPLSGFVPAFTGITPRPRDGFDDFAFNE
ncbi:ATP-binding protein [archaeon]|nr:MAG: ATP-binding protein [archaeon]